MGGNEYSMRVSVCFKYWLALLIFADSCEEEEGPTDPGSIHIA
jgi:hypothetical protein